MSIQFQILRPKQHLKFTVPLSTLDTKTRKYFLKLKPSKIERSQCVDTPRYQVFYVTPNSRGEIVILLRPKLDHFFLDFSRFKKKHCYIHTFVGTGTLKRPLEWWQTQFWLGCFEIPDHVWSNQAWFSGHQAVFFFSQSVTFEEHFWLSKRTLFGPLLERFGPPVDARYEKSSFWSVWTSGGCTLSSVLASGGCTLYKKLQKLLFSSLLRLRRSRKFCAPPRVIHFSQWVFLLIRS